MPPVAIGISSAADVRNGSSASVCEYPSHVPFDSDIGQIIDIAASRFRAMIETSWYLHAASCP